MNASRANRVRAAGVTLVVAFIGSAWYTDAHAIPVPPEFASLVGQWDTEGHVVQVDADGSVYRDRPNNKPLVCSKLLAVEGLTLVIGVSFWRERLVIDRMPAEADGGASMVVNGAVWRRTAVGE